MSKAPAVLAFVLLLQGPAQAERRVADRVVARVNSQPILLSQLRSRLRSINAWVSAQPASKRGELSRRYRRELLERRIDEVLIAQIAERRKISASDEDVDATLAEWAKQRKLTVDALLVEALASGYSERAYRAEVRLSLLEQRVVYAVIDTSDFPKDESARERWYERAKKQTLAKAREQGCIERLSR